MPKATAQAPLQALISNVQQYSIHDGPGVRSTVFFKGCPLICQWCHNPESQLFHQELHWRKDKCIGCGDCVRHCTEQALSFGPQGLVIDRERCVYHGDCAAGCPSLALELFGKYYTLPQLLSELLKDRVFYEQSGGGVTLSGGEPLAQEDFAIALLAELKKQGIHTTVDTAGFLPRRVFERAVPYTDLFLYDIKHLDSEVHERYTGLGNGPILDNLRYVAAQGKEVWVRVPVVPGVNDAPEHLQRVAALTRQLGLRRLHLLPYHKIAMSKYERMGLPYALADLPEPSDEQMQELAALLAAPGGLEVVVGG